MSYWIEPGPNIMSHVAFPYVASYFAIWLVLLVLTFLLKSGEVSPGPLPASRGPLTSERAGPESVRPAPNRAVATLRVRVDFGDETLFNEPVMIRLVNENRKD
jgi:hypothetical protein